MRLSKQSLSCLSALLVCAVTVFTFAAAAQTPQNPPMQSALWKDLDNLAAEGGYQDVHEFVNRALFLTRFPDAADKDIIRLWLRIRLKENPQYGLLYARLHLDEALAQSDYNSPTHREGIATAVMSFYTNALLIKSDLAACADETAGEDLKAELDLQDRKYRRQYNKLDPMLQAAVIRAIERSRDNSKNRRPDTTRCKTGGDTSPETVPDTLPDSQWQNRRDTIYRDTLESLQ